MQVLDIFEAATPRDKIITYLKSSRKGELFLTQSEMDYMEQLDYCDNMIRAHRHLRDKHIINMVVEKYQVSVSTARNLVLDTKYVHGSVSKPVKAYERQIMTDTLWQVHTKAMENKEYKAAVNALELIAKINGLDKEDESNGEDDGVKNIIIRPTYAPETLGVPNPENVDALVENLRRRTKALKQATEAITE
jgi:hypothetical protein